MNVEMSTNSTNQVIHGMWIGSSLSKLELLTLHSFVRFGHEFHLWAYDEIHTPLPPGVVLEDAERIIPQKKVFRKTNTDRASGVGRGSFGAPFSDLFRYKLLYEQGGFWVDMDVTCLKPFDFQEDYLFRPHRVGVVGNIMKCPKHSVLMRETYEQVEREAHDKSEWLMPNRVLSENVRRLGLDSFIRADICNEDSWWHAIKPMVEQLSPIPYSWYAIHWINEFWRTLARDQGYYKGKRLLDYVPNKDRPISGSTMEFLYSQYGLVDEEEPYPRAARPTIQPVQRQRLAPSQDRVSARQMPFSRMQAKRHINILMPSLTRGGAERSVLDILKGLRQSNTSAKLFLFYDVPLEYPVQKMDHVEIHRLSDLDEARKIKEIAFHVLAPPSSTLYTHLISAQQLRQLWNFGIKTIPVIQNSQPSWQDSPQAFDHPQVPMVVAVSEAVAEQLRQLGCPKPVVAIRHELQRWFLPGELQESREAVRRQHGISDDTLLIGMVGQFKVQKAYTRAVRVLHLVKQMFHAKLMILGGWDHAYGAGRAAFTAACRQALELGVMPDLILPGDVDPAEPYYAAFDIFLNTSIYEGLSVATLEAIQCGCPIVSADAGGNREVLPAHSALIEDSSDIEEYAEAIARIAQMPWRFVPPRPADPDVVPRLWALLGQFGAPNAGDGIHERNGTLFLTDNLNFGGPQRSLTNLLTHLPPSHKTALGVVDTLFRDDYAEIVRQAQVPVVIAEEAPEPMDKAEAVLNWVDAFRVANICFWNVDARVKLLVAKVLEARPVRLIDVSPGPMLFEEMANTRAFQKRITLSEAQYLSRLDVFVAKYEEGLPQSDLSATPKGLAVIPNGVPLPSQSAPIDPMPGYLPAAVDPAFAIGTCTRIVPSKRIDFLIRMMEILTERLPKATLTIVGGVDPRHLTYWNSLVDLLEESGLTNINFVGPHENVQPFLSRFRVFVMISDDQGCPNASLEAMAMGLPVVANDSGGTASQVRDGVNGYLVNEDDPAEMAQRVEYLLKHPKKLSAFADASRRIAEREFSMDGMVERYMQLLEPCKDEYRPEWRSSQLLPLGDNHA
jgi:glycosyltransferase involved in cell wall biosynthesis